MSVEYKKVTRQTSNIPTDKDAKIDWNYLCKSIYLQLIIFLSRENSQGMSLLRVKLTETNKRYQESRVEDRFLIFDTRRQDKSRMTAR